jgi:pilus assembly protein CpaF
VSKSSHVVTARSVAPSFLDAARRMHQLLLEALDLRRAQVERLDAIALRTRAAQTLALLRSDSEHFIGIDRSALERFVLDETLGLGALEVLLADDSVTEIMVNGPDEIFVERGGVLTRTSDCFSSETALRSVIERIVSSAGRRVDEASPMVDARLADGSRVNVILPPLALRGACITLRRFSRRMVGTQALLESGTVDPATLALLRGAVMARRNIVVAGGTGSGKTTLLNLLAGFIGAGERIITIEDAAELSLCHPHCVSLEARPPNLEGRGAVSVRDLVRNALRMRPDRIIVGECRGAEALDMLQAMNTGHEGSLTTVHANGPREALSRLEVMVHLAGVDLPSFAVREQIASAVDLVVQLARLADGRRSVVSITEVTGMEGQTLLTQQVGGPREPETRTW